MQNLVVTSELCKSTPGNYGGNIGIMFIIWPALLGKERIAGGSLSVGESTSPFKVSWVHSVRIVS